MKTMPSDLADLFKPLEPFLHSCMGFLAHFVNGSLLLELRERRQLPPGDPIAVHRFTEDLKPENAKVVRGGMEYWPKDRVMDTLNDLRQYQYGQTVAWVVSHCLCLYLGAKFIG
jgi:hypothetical protein